MSTATAAETLSNQHKFSKLLVINNSTKIKVCLGVTEIQMGFTPEQVEPFTFAIGNSMAADVLMLRSFGLGEEEIKELIQLSLKAIAAEFPDLFLTPEIPDTPQ